MTHYCKVINGVIEAYTDSAEVAAENGFDTQIENDIVRGYDGKFYIDGEQPNPPPKSYVELRMAAYPAIGEQLDMIYWDKVNGTNLWQSTISEIKARYPKA